MIEQKQKKKLYWRNNQYYELPNLLTQITLTNS